MKITLWRERVRYILALHLLWLHTISSIAVLVLHSVPQWNGHMFMPVVMYRLQIIGWLSIHAPFEYTSQCLLVDNVLLCSTQSDFVPSRQRSQEVESSSYMLVLLSIR